MKPPSCADVKGFRRVARTPTRGGNRISCAGCGGLQVTHGEDLPPGWVRLGKKALCDECVKRRAAA